MLGRKASLKALRATLHRHRPTALRTTEFAQGGQGFLSDGVISGGHRNMQAARMSWQVVQDSSAGRVCKFADASSQA